MMIGHPPDSSAAVQQAFIHIIILGGLQMLCPRILCSRTERERDSKGGGGTFWELCNDISYFSDIWWWWCFMNLVKCWASVLRAENWERRKDGRGHHQNLGDLGFVLSRSTGKQQHQNFYLLYSIVMPP